MFLVGSERSGTTLLRLMLDHHPEIAFEKEFDFVVTEVSDTGELPAVDAYLDWIADVRGANYAIDPALGYRELVNDFLRQKQAASGGKPHVGATIHRNFDRLRFLWPDARYIHLVRDPRDVARSVVQKGWAGNVYQGSEFWIQAESCWDSLVLHLTRRSRPSRSTMRISCCERSAFSTRSAGSWASSTRTRCSSTGRCAAVSTPRSQLWSLNGRPSSRRGNVALVELRTAGLLESRGYARSGHPTPRRSVR